MRSDALSTFLIEAEKALGAVTGAGTAVADSVVARWGIPAPANPGTQTLPVCAWIDPALHRCDTPLGRAFGAIWPALRWARRLSADPGQRPFWDGHANAMILGPGGLEDRDDIWVGATVMAPGVIYPDHDHPPAEVYLPLAAGAWWNTDMPWTDPGVGGFIYNPPGIRHSMRAGSDPFLALWFLAV